MSEEKLVSEEFDDTSDNTAALNEESKLKEESKWYVIHTYSGYENKVKANIEKIVENRNMYDLIHEVIIPVKEETVVSPKTGKQSTSLHKIFPTYVFVKMIMNDDTWYVVRNTRGVTSFVGPGSKPVPLTSEEVVSMGIEKNEVKCDLNVNDNIVITDGPFEGSDGVVKEVNLNKHTVIVAVNFFGRETPVELDFSQVQMA